MDAKKVSLESLYNDAIAQELGFTIDHKVSDECVKLIESMYEELALMTLMTVVTDPDPTKMLSAIQAFGTTILYRERMGAHK